MSLRGLYQVGYVTHALDRACETLGRDLGLSEFSRFDVDLPLRTPYGDEVASVRVGTAWAGSVQIELIQPVAGYVAAYLEALPADSGDATPQFHHLAARRESAEELERDAEQLGLPIVFRTSGAGIISMFIDTRARLGHYLELVSATPEGWATLGWPGAASS